MVAENRAGLPISDSVPARYPSDVAAPWIRQSSSVSARPAPADRHRPLHFSGASPLLIAGVLAILMFLQFLIGIEC